MPPTSTVSRSRAPSGSVAAAGCGSSSALNSVSIQRVCTAKLVAGERRVVDHGPVERQHGGHAADGELGQRAAGPLQRLLPAGAGDDQLADQRVERLRHRLARPYPASSRTPGPDGGFHSVIVPGRGQEVARRVLGVDPELDRVPAQRRVVVAERLAVGDPEHLPDQVEAG